MDEAALKLKPWWNVRAGRTWFSSPQEVILGADAAALEMRGPGDKFYSPEMQREFRVAAVLNRSGTSDDSAFFIPLATAQQMFGQAGQLTAIAIRLKDPALAREAAPRLQKVPGAQVVTMTEMCLETIHVCLAGGLAGALLAFLSAAGVESWLRARLPFAPTDPLIYWDWSLAGLCVAGAVLLGTLAALLPALRATELSPIEAIREGSIT